MRLSMKMPLEMPLRWPRDDMLMREHITDIADYAERDMSFLRHLRH